MISIRFLVIPNSGFILPFSATRITRVETFRRNVSTTRYNKKGKRDDKSGFSITGVIRDRYPASPAYASQDFTLLTPPAQFQQLVTALLTLQLVVVPVPLTLLPTATFAHSHPTAAEGINNTQIYVTLQLS